MARRIPPGQRKDYTPIYKQYGPNARRGVYRYAYTPNGQQQYDLLGNPITISNRAYLSIKAERRVQFPTLDDLVSYVARFPDPDLYYGFIVAHGRFREGYINAFGTELPPDEGWRNVRGNVLFSDLKSPEIYDLTLEEAQRIYTSVDTWELTWNEMRS